MRSPGAKVRSSAERVRSAANICALPMTEFRYSTETIILRLMPQYLDANWTKVLAGPSVLVEYKEAMGTISLPWSPVWHDTILIQNGEYTSQLSRHCRR